MNDDTHINFEDFLRKARDLLRQEPVDPEPVQPASHDATVEQFEKFIREATNENSRRMTVPDFEFNAMAKLYRDNYETIKAVETECVPEISRYLDALKDCIQTHIGSLQLQQKLYDNWRSWKIGTQPPNANNHLILWCDHELEIITHGHLLLYAYSRNEEKMDDWRNRTQALPQDEKLREFCTVPNRKNQERWIKVEIKINDYDPLSTPTKQIATVLQALHDIENGLRD